MTMMPPPDMGWERGAYATMDSQLEGKTPPEEVNYREAVDPEQACAECGNFLPPDKCAVVAGKVDPAGLCDLFSGETETESPMEESYE